MNELLTRSERLVKFNDVEDVRHHLDRLIQRQPALVQQIPRGPGQREDRYAQLLCGEPAMPERSTETSTARAHDSDAMEALLARIDALEARVSALEASADSASD